MNKKSDVRNKHQMDITSYLREYDLFKGISQAALKSLSSSAVLRTLSAKEIVFNEGFEGNYFYILVSGTIRVFKTSFEGKESTIKIIHEGEFFAEVVLFQKTVYPASGIATEKSVVLGIHRDSFNTFLRDHTNSMMFIKGIFGKMRYLTDTIHYLNSYDVEDRFFRFIIEHYGKHYRYDISLPKKEIASAIGTIPETFSRLILRLTRMGIIGWKKNILFIKEGFWDNEYFEE